MVELAFLYIVLAALVLAVWQLMRWLPDDCEPRVCWHTSPGSDHPPSVGDDQWLTAPYFPDDKIATATDPGQRHG